MREKCRVPVQKNRMMKAYKYTINGNKYEIAIGDIVENVADISVNGESF